MLSKVVTWRKRFSGQDSLAQFVRGSGGSLLSRFGSSGVALGSTIVLTNFLGPEYGDYAFAISWMTALVLLGRLGFNKSAIKYLASYASQHRWGLLRGFMRYSLRTTYLNSAALSILFGVILFAAGDLIKDFYQDDGVYHCLLIAAVTLPFMAHLELGEGLLDGFKRVVLSQLPLRTLRPALIALMIAVTFYWTPLGSVTHEMGRFLSSESAMLINLVATLFALVLSVSLVRGATPSAARTIAPEYTTREWLSTSTDMMVTSGFNLILVQADVMLLGILVDTEAAGLYTVASRVALLLILALTSVNAILHPMTADLYVNRRFDELQRIISIGANAVFLISLLGGVLLYLGGNYLHLVFGPGFSEAGDLLRILIIGQLVNAFSGPAIMLLNMTGHQRDAAKIMAAGALLNLALNALFITLFGAVGAAIATSTTTVLWNLAAAYIVWSRLKIVCIAFWPVPAKPAS